MRSLVWSRPYGQNHPRERMNARDNEVFTRLILINARTLSSVINSFSLVISQLSQFLTRPILAEITHKRRIRHWAKRSRERAGFEVRDVHYSITVVFAPLKHRKDQTRFDLYFVCACQDKREMGFIETPTVKWTTEKLIWKLTLSAEEEDLAKLYRQTCRLRLLNEDRSPDRWFPDSRKRRSRNMDVSPTRLLVWVSLIPFLEHDDANRALMGSNMQRQAVPLIQLGRCQIVGTGLEARAARDARVHSLQTVKALLSMWMVTKFMFVTTEWYRSPGKLWKKTKI